MVGSDGVPVHVQVDDGEYAALSQVRIETVTAHTVTFATRSGSVTGDRDEQLRRVFSVPLSEILTTPIFHAPSPVALVPGAIGTLFLSRTGWLTKSADGFGIHGADRAVFNWPHGTLSSMRYLTRLAIVPSSVIVRGHLSHDPTFYDVELLGEDALAEQDIRWNAAEPLVIRLSLRGARRLRIPTRTTTVELWPTSLLITGSPAFDPSASGLFDLLDDRLAGVTQRFSLDGSGAPISLKLPRDGVSAFHTAPEATVHKSHKITFKDFPQRGFT